MPSGCRHGGILAVGRLASAEALGVGKGKMSRAAVVAIVAGDFAVAELVVVKRMRDATAAVGVTAT